MFYPDTNGSPSTDTNSADNDMPWNGNASDAPVFPDDDSEFDSDYDAD